MLGFARLLALAASLLASPALGAPTIPSKPPVPPAAPTCSGPALERVAHDVGTAERFRFDGDMVQPFVAILASRKGGDVAIAPDGVDVFAKAGTPLIVALREHGCVLAVMMVPRDELYSAMRRIIGPVI